MTYKLLLADDSVTIQRVIELTFSGEDVQVVTVSDGEQAIARLPIEKPDIVLADIGMPKRSGYDVAAFVKEHPELSRVPVLLLAGAFEPVDETRAKQVGCDGILVKPFEPQHVIARVRELIDARRRETGVAGPDRRAAGPVPPITGPAPRVPESKAPPAPAAAREPEGASEVSGRRAPDVEPRLPVPELGVASPGADDSGLDDYFDRLDEAFATLGNSAGAPAPRAGPFGPDETVSDVPTIDEVLAGAALQHPSPPPPAAFGRIAPPPAEPPDASATLSAAPRPHATPPHADRANAIAEAFNVLFAVEQGDLDPATIRIGPPAAPVPVTDELVEQVTRRVLERLAPDTARGVVAEIVSEVAERLVRDEIERIRGSR